MVAGCHFWCRDGPPPKGHCLRTCEFSVASSEVNPTCVSNSSSFFGGSGRKSESFFPGTTQNPRQAGLRNSKWKNAT